MPERMQATIAVFACMVNAENEVYLQRRFQTGYRDGSYDTPAGKVDEGEFPIDAVCREAFEEAGVTIDPNDLELFHTYTNLSNDNAFVGLMYRTHKWQGEPSIQELEKCDDTGFFSFDQLPNVTPPVRDGLAVIATAATISMSHYDDISR